MHRKQLAVAFAAVALVAGGVFVAITAHRANTARQQSADLPGIVNPDYPAAGTKTREQPRLSDERFTPPPTITTGTYDPKRRDEPAAKGATRKNPS
jgi:hypothetical protein